MRLLLAVPRKQEIDLRVDNPQGLASHYKMFVSVLFPLDSAGEALMCRCAGHAVHAYSEDMGRIQAVQKEVNNKHKQTTTTTTTTTHSVSLHAGKSRGSGESTCTLQVHNKTDVYRCSARYPP